MKPNELASQPAQSLISPLLRHRMAQLQSLFTPSSGFSESKNPVTPGRVADRPVRLWTPQQPLNILESITTPDSKFKTSEPLVKKK